MALFCVGAAALALSSSRSDAPAADDRPRYFRRPFFSGALLVAFAAYFGIFSIFFFTALYLQVVTGYSGYRIAALFAPMAAALIAGSRRRSLGGARRPAPPDDAGLPRRRVRHPADGRRPSRPARLPGVAAALALAGLGFGVVVVPATSVGLGTVPPEHSGMAAAATTTSRELGTVIGVAVLGSLVNGQLAGGLAQRLSELGVPAAFRAW